MLLSPTPIRIFKGKIYTLTKSYEQITKAQNEAKKLRREEHVSSVKVLRTHEKKLQYSVYVNKLSMNLDMLDYLAPRKNVRQEYLYNKKVGC